MCILCARQTGLNASSFSAEIASDQRMIQRPIVLLLFSPSNLISLVPRQADHIFSHLFDYNYLAELHCCVTLTSRVYAAHTPCTSAHLNLSGRCLFHVFIHLYVHDPVTISSNATGAINCPTAMPFPESRSKNLTARTFSLNWWASIYWSPFAAHVCYTKFMRDAYLADTTEESYREQVFAFEMHDI